MTIDELIEGLKGLNEPDQGMRYHSGGLIQHGPVFDEQTGERLPPRYKSPELTVYGERARFLYALIDNAADILAALHPAPAEPDSLLATGAGEVEAAKALAKDHADDMTTRPEVSAAIDTILARLATLEGERKADRGMLTETVTALEILSYDAERVRVMLEADKERQGPDMREIGIPFVASINNATTKARRARARLQSRGDAL